MSPLLSLLLTSTALLQASPALDQPYVLLLVDAAPTNSIVSASLAAESLRAILPSSTDRGNELRVAAFLEQPAQLTRLAAQSRLQNNGHYELLVRLPDDVRTGRVRIYAAQDQPASHESHRDLVQVRVEGNTITVNNGLVEVVHDARLQGGLPSKIRFLHSGHSLTDFLLNDRIYRPDLGQFPLRSDSGAEVSVQQQGPLEAVVHVRARYLSDGVAPPSQPMADYTFVYRAGWPAIEVRAEADQGQACDWSEHHLMEWNFPSQTFRTWAGGPGLRRGEFERDEQTVTTESWGALTDGSNLVGILGGQVRFYSGTPTYGAYIHGPWTSWSGRRHSVSCTLWLDSRPDALTLLRTAAETSQPARRARLTTPDIEALREQVEARIADLPVGEPASLHRWWLALTQRLLLEEGQLLETAASYDQQNDLLHQAAGTDEILARMRTALDAGPIQRNARLAVLWARADQGCFPASVYLPDQQREVLAGLPESIWSLEVETDPGNTQRWGGEPHRFACEVEASEAPGADAPDHRLLIGWTQRDAADPLRVELESILAESSLHLRLTATGGGNSASILQATFPQIRLGPLGADCDDDVFFRPTVSGRLVRGPLRHGLDFHAAYPSGWGSLPFVAHWDDLGGIYLGIHDPLASTKDLSARSDPRGGGLLMQVQWPAPDATRLGNGFRHSGSVILAPLAGDWYDASQIYRRWAEREAAWWPARDAWGRPDTPKWMEEICVWALASGGPSSVVEPVTEFARFMEVPTAVHWYNWHEVPFDDDYPHYFPAKPGFADGVRQLQQAGVRVMPYINGRLWDSDLEDFSTSALPAATKDRHGQYYIEEYGSGQKLVPMCPTQPLWQATVHDIVMRLIGPECNVDGVYIDQVAAAAPRLCHDATHGHPLAGGHWWTTAGYWPMMERIRGAIRDRFPDKMLTTECSADPYLHAFDAYLTWHYQDPDAVPAVAAVCSGKIQSFGRAIRGGDELAHRMKIAQGLVYGEQLWWGPTDIIRTQPETAAFLRRCARLRHHLLPHLARGRLARPPQLHGDIPRVTADWAWSGTWPVSDSAVQAGAWLAEDGSIAYVFANSTQEPQSFRWSVDTKALPAAATYTLTRVSETGPAAPEIVPARRPHEVTLGPLDARAFVIRP